MQVGRYWLVWVIFIFSLLRKLKNSNYAAVKKHQVICILESFWLVMNRVSNCESTSPTQSTSSAYFSIFYLWIYRSPPYEFSSQMIIGLLQIIHQSIKVHQDRSEFNNLYDLLIYRSNSLELCVWLFFPIILLSSQSIRSTTSLEIVCLWREKIRFLAVLAVLAVLSDRVEWRWGSFPKFLLLENI